MSYPTITREQYALLHNYAHAIAEANIAFNAAYPHGYDTWVGGFTRAIDTYSGRKYRKARSKKETAKEKCLKNNIPCEALWAVEKWANKHSERENTLDKNPPYIALYKAGFLVHHRGF